MSMRFWSVLSLGFLMALVGSRANALPGQSTEEVATWIQANPTLRPGPGEKLLVRRTDTAAQRFTFQASVLPPGEVVPIRDRGTIRSERISLFDAVNGVTQERLEESLRVIYGLDILQDFQRASVVYAYPGPASVVQARRRNTPLRSALQGELRSGDRYAYWLEIAQPAQGRAFSGQLVVMLREDLERLETQLRNLR